MGSSQQNNVFLQSSLPSVFLKTAAPIILIMLVNGSFTLVDAYFLGVFVGADALTAVTSMFPIFIFLIALSTLVSNGFSSVMARQLGAGDLGNAVDTFAQAITQSILVCLVLIGLFFLGGREFTLLVSHGNHDIASMSYSYISILILASPLAFLLTVNGDSLRCEGHMAFMAITSLFSILLNGLFNYIFIVVFSWGVEGSAYGSVLAQAINLVIIFLYRKRSSSGLSLQVVQLSSSYTHWKTFLTLGAPSSLNYLGLSLTSGAILFNLSLWSADHYEVTVGAYGIITRLMTFIFLPLLGLSMAFQTIVGNNIGAKEARRANTSIKIALFTSLVYGAVCQSVLLIFKDRLGAIFVNDVQVINEVARILPIASLALFTVGPLMMITMLFQAMGDAKRAAILGVMKTYFFTIPLIFLLPFSFSEVGIWIASPSAEVLGWLLAIYVLIQRYRNESRSFGLFFDERVQRV
jgi:putative MATE family efflux protein